MDAVRPEPLVMKAVWQFPKEWKAMIRAAPVIRVVGCGKAGAAMATGLEAAMPSRLKRMVGVVNVPEGYPPSLRKIRLHAARPVGSNHPTAAGVAGANEMLQLLRDAGPEDVAICLISGGGSALLPAPVEGISLEDKQAVTKLLHACGASITEMNAVRKHLSRVKGGRLAEAFRGKLLISLIISDVVGDELDVIASGPTVPDRTKFAGAWRVLEKYDLLDRVPDTVRQHLLAGVEGKVAETPKELSYKVVDRIIGSSEIALNSAKRKARSAGYTVVDLGVAFDGDTTEVAFEIAGFVASIRSNVTRFPPPVCMLMGGETTVKLGDSTGMGGRNQEFVLAMLIKLGEVGFKNVCVLSGGTDGEDGPTDAAGAVVTEETLRLSREAGVNPQEFLARHDSYHFFQQFDGLIRTGLTNTNVMDVRVILIV